MDTSTIDRAGIAPLQSDFDRIAAIHLYAIPVDRIKDVKIIRTVAGGNPVYEG